MTHTTLSSDSSRTRRLALAGVFTALAIVGSFFAAHEVVGVALIVLVADADHADLQGLAFGVVAVFFGRLRLVVAAFRRGVVRGVLRFLIVPAVRTAGGEHADREHENEKQRKYLLQSFFLLDIVGSPQCAFAAVRP